MSSLIDIRNKIDIIDEDIVKLLTKRTQLVQDTVKYKETENDILVNQRTEEVIIKVRQLANKNEIPANMVDDAYRIILDYAVELELHKFKNKEVF